MRSVKQHMKITVHREACCSQDDQVGPLEAEYDIETDTTFSSLIEVIIKSRFLQFSSTHNRISGEVDGEELVEIFSPYSANARQPAFMTNPSASAVELVGERILSFYFRHV